MINHFTMNIILNKNSSKLLILLILTSNLFCYSQNTNTTELYKWLDNAVGKENLNINNGKLLLNYDKPINGIDRFFSPIFENNSVQFDNQIYNDVTLNYDVLNDDVIIKPLGVNDRRQIIALKENIDYFTINSKKFKNLNYKTVNLPVFVNGFYEEKLVTSNVILFIKHFKNKRNFINGDKTNDDFEDSNSFLIYYNEVYYEINSKKNSTTLFPQLTENIDAFYTNYDYLERTNKTEFYEKLFSMINANLK